MFATDTNTPGARPASAIVVAGLLLCVLVFGAGASAAPESGSQSTGAPIRQAQVLESDRTGLVAPVGIAFSPAGDAFHVVSAGGGPAGATDVVRLTPFALAPGSDRAGSARIAAAIADPINVAFDPRRNRLLLLDQADRLLSVEADASGALDPATLDRRGALRLDLHDPQGMALDPESGTLYLLDAATPRILRVEPDTDGDFQQAQVSEVDLGQSGVGSARGLAFDPVRGTLYLTSGQELLELTQAGEPLTRRDLSGLELESPQGMVFAPSGDQTDDPSQLSLWVADSGRRQARQAAPTASPGPGQIVELSLAPLAAAEAIDFTSALVNTVDMAAWSPPSPDASGVAYLAASNRLVMVDGEVEETVSNKTHFQGANVWEFTLGGSVLRTANISKVSPTVVPMTNEPTGIAHNPSNGHYYVTDDNAKEVYDLNPGGDGLIGTSDDSWTNFDTAGVGSGDPEGVTYDSWNNRVFVADGVNAEVYQFTTSGTLVGQFDTLQYGVDDPESVDFNPVTGTLFVISKKANGPIVIETTTAGALLQTIDVSAMLAAGGNKPAGLAYAPAGNGSGLKRFYIVDRGVDNNSDPNIVDGKMFELTAPEAGAPGNQPPSVDAGPDQQLTLPAAATLDGTVSDDGLPDPPAAFTTTWSQVSGPGSVTFADPNAIDTTASFSVTGTYTLRLTADDSELAAFDELTVTVDPVGTNQPPAVNAGLDQTIIVPAAAILDGTVTDDGLPNPPGSLTTSWSQASGPGTATFADPSAVDTTATFDAPGVYVLRLSADDSDLSAFDELTMTVLGPGGTESLDVSVGANPDDAEENTTGQVRRGSSDLNMTVVSATETNVAVGMRFTGLDIPPGVTITNAYVQFQADEADSEPTQLTIWGEDSDNAVTFNTTTGNISSRPTTSASTVWSPDPWAVGEAGPAQRTPNIAGVVQEVVNRPGWASGNALVVIVTGSGRRVAVSYNAVPAAAALLHVEWTTGGGGGNTPPTITSDGGGSTASVSAPENQTAVTDVDATDPDPDTLTYSLAGGADQAHFAIDSVSGALTFTSPPDFESPTDADSNNVYEVTVSVSDGNGGSDSQAISVTVTDVPEGGNQPPVITSDGGGSTASVSAPENQTAVTDVDATDPDPDTLTYSLAGGADQALFSIDSSSGVLTFASPPDYESPADADSNNVYEVTVSVSDGNGGSDSQAISVTVANVNEFAPVITSDGGGDTASLSRPENQTAVTIVTATDGDLTSPTYSITGGADQALFTISSSTGVLTFASPPDFESPADVDLNNEYLVTVAASDGSFTDFQAISVTVTDVSESFTPFYFTLRDRATLGGMTVENEDIVHFDGASTFSVYFDGSDVGIKSLRIDAFARLDDTTLLMSFDSDRSVPDVGAVDDSDIVKFVATSLGDDTAGTFSLYFDGSDVGLTASAADVNAFELLPDGRMLISTQGSVTVGGVSARDEDLLEFVPTSLDDDGGGLTAGTFSLYFDGSDVGFSNSGEDLNSVSVDSAGKIYFSTLAGFSVPGLDGQDEDVAGFTPTSIGSDTTGAFDSTLFFDGSTFGLDSSDVYSIDVP